MTTTTVAPAPAGDAAASSPAGKDGFLRRNRIWFLVGVALAVALAVAVWTSGDDPRFSAPLDPQNPDPDGAQALAQVLEDEGVEVTIARSADELREARARAGTTVVVTSTDQLAPSTIRRLERDARGADVILVEPPHHVLREIQRGVEASYSSDETSGDCSDDRSDDQSDDRSDDRSDERFAGLTLTVDSATGYDTDHGCFPDDDTFVLAEGRRGWTYFGAGQALTNDQVLRGDNAAVALRLLGASDRLVWYVPTYDDAAADEAVSIWTFAPDWLAPSLWLALFAGAASMWWRGRRLGRLAAEPLPVVVRAVETTRSRGRMYRRADDRAYAAGALRAAARRRVADTLRLGRGASEAEVIGAAARHLDRREDEIGALLAQHAPAPGSDDELVRLAQQLTQLDREVRRG